MKTQILFFSCILIAKRFPPAASACVFVHKGSEEIQNELCFAHKTISNQSDLPLLFDSSLTNPSQCSDPWLREHRVGSTRDRRASISGPMISSALTTTSPTMTPLMAPTPIPRSVLPTPIRWTHWFCSIAEFYWYLGILGFWFCSEFEVRWCVS